MVCIRPYKFYGRTETENTYIRTLQSYNLHTHIVEPHPRQGPKVVPLDLQGPVAVGDGLGVLAAEVADRGELVPGLRGLYTGFQIRFREGLQRV